MAIVLRFVNDNGEIIERFFGVVHANEFSAQGLKDAVEEYFAKNGLSLSRLRGQGFDGVCDMRDELNELKDLILNGNKHAHYIHCFAYELEPVVVSVASYNLDVYQFFDSVSMIVNTVESSCKIQDTLRRAHCEEILEKIRSGIVFGEGKNQEIVLPGATSWGSYYETLIRLFDLWSWNYIEELLLALGNDGDGDDDDSGKIQWTAMDLAEKMGTFEFVFNGMLMWYLLGFTNPVAKLLEDRNQNIASVVRVVELYKNVLQGYKEEGWEQLLEGSNRFCASHKIKVPNLADSVERRIHWLKLVDGEPKTYFHHIRVKIMTKVIDEVIIELNHRFDDTSTVLLNCTICLHPAYSVANYGDHKILHLAKIYSEDFSDVEVADSYIDEVRGNSKFSDLDDMGTLAKKMVETKFHIYFPLVYRLIELALILPIATATEETTFSAMDFAETDLCDWLGDELLSDHLLCYIEKKIFIGVEDEAILQCFQQLKSRGNILP